MNPFLLCDGYKVGHVFQYPPGTTQIYSNLTPRKTRLQGYDSIIWFGMQAAVMKLYEIFNRDFFQADLDAIMGEYQSVITKYMGGLPSYDHIRYIHKLGYLPLRIKSLPEGSRVPFGVPVMTITNTVDEAFWLPNWCETILSSMIWQPVTSATIADKFRQIITSGAHATGANLDFVRWQGHDFSFRGMSSPESAMASGAGWLTSFYGTDTIPAIMYLNTYYGAGFSTQPVGGSVPATEHSVMSMGGKESEIETFSRLLDVYPSGILSVVSDTWNLWDVLTKYMPQLKDKIMAREGKLVVRPDSGDPVDIICGDPKAQIGSPEFLGVIRLLFMTFGGTKNAAGYIELDSHVGAIYGDAITEQRAKDILARLAYNGFASSNIVFGVGSYTLQYNTRDTFGLAMKATAGRVGSDWREIFKDPITDDGTKKSARGLLSVHRNADGVLELHDRQTPEEEETGELRVIFEDHEFNNFDSLDIIRKRIDDTFVPF